MKHFNLVKSLTRVNNIITLPFREGHGVGRMFILSLALATFGVNDAWGTYYGKFSVTVSTNSTGKGSVYAAEKNNASSGNSSVSISTSTKSGSVNAYAFATSNAGYHLQGWSKTNGYSDLGTNNPYTMSGNASGTKDGTNDNGTWYASFIPSSADVKINEGVTAPDLSTKVDGSVVFTISNADALDDFKKPISISTDGPGSFTVGDWSYLSGEITINYTYYPNNSIQETTGKMDLVSAGDDNTCTVYITGKANKKRTTIKWDIPTFILNEDEEISNPAHAENNAEVKYKIKDGQPTDVIEISGTTLTGRTKGRTCTIIAYVEEDDTWAYAEDEKTFTVTNKQKQNIDWSQPLSFNYSGTELYPTLTASALTNISYSIPSEAANWITISGNTLKITGTGTTTITATAEETEEYVGVSITRTLISRDPTATCDDPIYDDGNSREFSASGGSHTTGTFSKHPRSITFQASKNMATAAGALLVEEYYAGEWHEVETIDVDDLVKNSFKDFGYNLNYNTTQVKFSCTGLIPSYKRTIKNIKVLQAKSISANVESIHFDAQLGTQKSQTFFISYDNAQGPLYITCNEPSIICPPEIEANCGDAATNKSIKVTLNPTTSFSNKTLTISDQKNGGRTLNIPISATVEKNDLSIDWNPNITDKKNHGEIVTMDATSNNTDYTNYPITFTSSNTDYATVDGNKVTFLAAGAGQQVTITANQAESNTYKSASLSKTFTIKNKQLLTYNNGQVNVSIDEDCETIDVSTLKIAQTGDGDITYAIKSGEGGVLNGMTFYGTVANEVVITATAANTANYEAVSKDFTINVTKRIPTFSWKQYDHIYAGEILEDVASTFYNGNSVDLQLTYTNVSGSFAVEGNKLYISKQFTDAHNATVRVTTTETDYYASTSAEHEYYLESKALPKFYLNGVEMSTETENNLTLKVGETANVSFDQTEESAFTYTTNAQFVTYAHDATQHAGVFTATASGDEGFQFHQAGTTTVFDRTCQMHIWVKKHTNTLSSPIQDNDVWMVDSIYEGNMYSIIDDGYTGHAQESVIVESDNEAVIRHQQDGSWKAVGEGIATITMRQFNNAYWTGDTITRVIKVQKHTPIITWNIENAQYPWSSVISTPVTSSNTDIPFTITSNNKSVADYVDGRIVVYNTTGSVTFTLTQEGNYKWNAATTNLTKSFSTFQPANHVPFTLSNNNNTNFYSTHSGTYTWSNGYKIGNGGINTFNKNTSSVTIRFTGVPDKLSFTKTLSKVGLSLPGDGDCNCYVYESADGLSWSQCWKDVERVETKNVSNIQLQPTTRYLKFEYKESCVYCTYSNITVTERSSIEPQASSLDFGTGYNGNTAAKRSVDVNWYSVMPCTVTISGADASQFYVGDDSKTIASSLDNSGIVTLNVFYTHEENKSHTATLTITSADTPAKTATIQLVGTTERAPQEIIWREDITPLPHNGGVYEGAALASSGGEVVLTSDDESIVKVVGNGLQPVGVGKTMVHAYQAGDDIKWQPVNATKEIEVTSLSVQHLIWNDQLNNIKRTDGQTVNITLTAQSDAIALDPSLVVTYELDDDAKTFASVTDNQLTITGWGSGYITAKQVGNANYVPAQQTKRLVSRNPDVDCRALAAEDANEYTLHTIASQEINITNGEPATIEFDAKMDLTAIGEGLHLDEWYNGSWHEATYIDWDVMAKNLGSYAHYGPYNLNRKTTKVRFYTNTGATMRRYFKNVEVTLARYLEVAQNDMSFAGVDKGAFLDQTFYINYSNLRGALDVELQNTSSNLQVITTTVGNDCGEIGQMVPIKIRCTGNVCGTENNVIVLSNKGQKLEVPVSATVVPPSQNITWNPQTTILTTDVVALNATCTSNLPISYSSNNTDVATVQQDGSGVWSMTIIKDGTVTITASQAGSADWSPAPDKNVVFNISKATPVVTTWATPSEVTKWSALSTSTLTGGEASVAGSFSWQDGTIQVERGNSGYTMVFTPTNTNWYNTVTNTIVVPVAKDPQTITWNYTPQPMYCNAELYFDAVASSGLKVRYESSDPTIAYVNDNRLVIIKGGNVTITAVQDGDDTWAYTSLSKNLDILRWTPNIVTKPVANSMLIGQHLDNATLNGGRAELDSKQVDGSFSWQNGSVETIDVAGKATRVVVFTPSNPNHYNSATCEVEVDVKKYAPTVTHTLSATDITYGQALNASSLNGTLTAMDEVKYPHEEVAGTYNWKETTKQLSAGKHTEIVRFTPSNLDWYDVVDIEISVVVNKAHATTATAVVNMLYGQTLEEVLPINTTADVVSGVVEGIITWDASVDVEAIPVQGEYDYPIHLAITDPNYVAETIDGTCHVVVEKGFVFDGHGGSSDWNTEGNWVDGSQPTGMEDKVIVIADATIINSEINVGAITIKQGVDVIIEEDGVLNVGDYDCVSRKQYGNMVVKNGGQLNLNTGEVQVNDFTLEASLGGQKDAERVSARSGSITNAEQLKVNGNAYFDIALDANGECTQGWYDLTVPFPVNALTGVQRFENGVLRTNLKNEVNYAIMSYHEDVRAQGKYGWSKFRGIMQPGQCYTITIDDYHNVYRFVKTASGSLNASNTLQVTATDGEGGDENKGWNCVGNGTCHHANIAIEGVDKVQIYDHATNSYSPINFADKTFAVGSAFFVQTPQSESILYSQHVSDGVLYAPRRAPHATQEFLVTLSSIKDQNVEDKLYLSASEDAMDTYEIGHDLSKFGVSSTIAQMWCTAYNMQLCDVELPWVGETAIFPIEIFAPKTGEYILSVPQTHKDEQLFLLYDGIMMTELTASEFILPLNKGVNKNYALQIVENRSIATNNENNEMLQNASTRKAIVNDKLYIFCGDKIFDANGKRIK